MGIKQPEEIEIPLLDLNDPYEIKTVQVITMYNDGKLKRDLETGFYCFSYPSDDEQTDEEQPERRTWKKSFDEFKKYSETYGNNNFGKHVSRNKHYKWLLVQKRLSRFGKLNIRKKKMIEALLGVNLCDFRNR
jgi:hypothetical protein